MQLFITTEDAEDTENGHFMGNYGVSSVSSASSVVRNILLIVPAAYQKALQRPEPRLSAGKMTGFRDTLSFVVLSSDGGNMIGPVQLGILGLIVVLLFGTKKLPELGSGLGKAISNFKNAYRESAEIDVTPKVTGKDEQSGGKDGAA